MNESLVKLEVCQAGIEAYRLIFSLALESAFRSLILCDCGVCIR